MTDRELLEMAAKAAEFGQETKHGPCWTESEYPRGSKTHGALWNYKGHMDTAELWNPLNDDGDALRLAVVLSIRLTEFKGTVVKSRGVAWKDGYASCSLWEPEGTDPYAATRRAIVRAAAAIGKAMP